MQPPAEGAGPHPQGDPGDHRQGQGGRRGRGDRGRLEVRCYGAGQVNRSSNQCSTDIPPLEVVPYLLLLLHVRGHGDHVQRGPAHRGQLRPEAQASKVVISRHSQDSLDQNIYLNNYTQ